MQRTATLALLAALIPTIAKAEVLEIASVETPVRTFRAPNITDGNLNTRWFNDNRAINAWFELHLDSPRQIEALEIAIGRERDRPIQIIVDGGYVGEFVLQPLPTVGFRRLELPEGTEGRVVRIEAYSRPGFSVHEARLIGPEEDAGPPPSLGGLYRRTTTLQFGASGSPGEWRSAHVACDPGDPALSGSFDIAATSADEDAPSAWPQHRLIDFRPEVVDGVSGWRFTLINDGDFEITASFDALCQNAE